MAALEDTEAKLHQQLAAADKELAQDLSSTESSNLALAATEQSARCLRPVGADPGMPGPLPLDGRPHRLPPTGLSLPLLHDLFGMPFPHRSPRKSAAP